MLVIGHRGAPSIKEENTLDSFQEALNHNVDGIELDVQLSQDHKLIVLHDLHTHKLNGKHDLIRNYSFNELKKLNYQIPVLEEILKIMPLHKELHIEIKSNQINNDVLITKIYNLLSKYTLEEQTILSSFNPFVLSTLKQFSNSIRVGLLWTQCPKEPWFITHYSYYKIKPYSFHASIKYMNKEMVEWAKKHNMKLYYYTINNTQSLKKAEALYADGIFSDYPNILD